MFQANVIYSPADLTSNDQGAADQGRGAVSSPAAPLSTFRKGDRGVIVAVGAPANATGPDSRAGQGLAQSEIERRLLELGFVEGAVVELLHEGMIGRDPIALRIDDMRVALRRREAAYVFVDRTHSRRGAV